MIPEARVLVADDDQSIRQLLGTIIQREGFPVDTVADGAEAIEKLRTHQYSVILLDLMMPRLDGFEVIEYLKIHHGPIKPVVLVISAYADQRFKHVDADIVAGVIRKPFEVAELGGMIRLCVKGFEDELSEKLHDSTDRTIREFARKYGNMPEKTDS
jgi:two-component system OmpR family response regulator